ncbi:MAG: GNAT family N-acetyltransferase [Micromonosporaceae bacterium]
MSDEVWLRDVEEADLEVFFAQEHDPEAVRRARFTPRDRERFMDHWATHIIGGPEVFVQAAIVDDEVAGNLVAWWEREKRFVGYWFGREYWGQGVGTKALTLFLQVEKARPLHADPYTGNTGSVRLLEKCGFESTGPIWHGEHEHVMLVLR